MFLIYDDFHIDYFVSVCLVRHGQELPNHHSLPAGQHQRERLRGGSAGLRLQQGSALHLLRREQEGALR